jgi:hypothetical protein
VTSVKKLEQTVTALSNDQVDNRVFRTPRHTPQVSVSRATGGISPSVAFNFQGFHPRGKVAGVRNASGWPLFATNTNIYKGSVSYTTPILLQTKKKYFVAFSPQVNYTDWTTATYWRNLVSTFVDRGVSRGQRGGSPTVVNLSFLDQNRYFSFK